MQAAEQGAPPQPGETDTMLFLALSRPQLLVILTIGGLGIALAENAAPPNASVYIISPKDGETVTNPFKVQFGLSGMGLRRPVSTNRTPVTIIC